MADGAEPAGSRDAMETRRRAAPATGRPHTLADDLRSRGRLSVRTGCEQGVCGSCTVLLNDETVRSCLVLAAQADGARVAAVEDLAGDPLLEHLRRTFWSTRAFQCGFCASGHLIESYSLLREDPAPTEDQVRRRLAGNLCRCTGYDSIVHAVLRAAGTLPATAREEARHE